MYKFFLLVLFTVVNSQTQKFISIPLFKHVDESGARILQEAVNSGHLTNKSSPTTTLSEKFKDDKYLQYYGRVDIGTPPQKFNISFNPSVSLTLIASNRYRKKCSGYFRSFDEQSSHSYRELGETLELNNGSIAIKMTKDIFHLPNIHIVDQHFGLVMNGTCEDTVYDGVIGLGFSNNYLTFLDNLVKQKSIESSIAGLFLDRNVKSRSGGELSLGNWNRKYVENPATAEYIQIVHPRTWTIKVKSAFIGDEQFTFDRVANIDLNSYFIDIPYFEAQQIVANTGAINYKGNLIVDCKRVNSLPKIYVYIKNSVYTLAGNDYVDTVNSYKGYCTVLIRSSEENTWNLGGAFLSKYYTIFDYVNNEIAFAKLIPPKSKGSWVHARMWYTSPFLLLTFLIHYLR